MANEMMKRLAAKLEKFDSETLADKETFKADGVWASTGLPELEYNLGVLGFPVGITEVAGPSQSGKTTIGLTGMKNFLDQHPNGVAVMLLSEERINREYAKKIGVDVSRVLIVRSRFVEDLFFKFQIHIDEIAEVWREMEFPGRPKIYGLWDSIGTTNSRAELETFKENTAAFKTNTEKGNKQEIKHAKVGDFAKTAKACAKAVLAQLYEKDIVFVCLNHVMDAISTGPMGKKGKDSGGGTWKEFLPCLRLQTAHKEWVSLDDEQVGQRTIVKVIKNDFGSRRKTEIEMLRGVGVVLSEADIEYGIEQGIIKKESATKRSFLNGKVAWSSTRTFYALYHKQPKMMQILHKKVMDARHKDVLAEKQALNEE